MVLMMEELTQRFGNNVSAKKSEFLYIGRDVSDIRVEDVQLKGQGQEFTYLGSVIASNGKFTQEIERRKAATTRAFGVLRRRLWGR